MDPSDPMRCYHPPPSVNARMSSLLAELLLLKNTLTMAAVVNFHRGNPTVCGAFATTA